MDFKSNLKEKAEAERVASIDIGTNTILLLVAEMGKGILRPLLEKETIVRLGESVQRNKILLNDAMGRGVQTLSEYLTQCQAMGVGSIFAAGTSALREAKNSEDFLRRVQEELKLSIEIISGEEEAQLSFLAVARDLKEKKKSILVVDVGGGSTELTSGKGDRITHWMSLPIGSVRLTEQFLLSDPVHQDEWKKMKREILGLFEKIHHPEKPFLMVAVGGTATTLASVEQGLNEFISEKVHHFTLSRESLEKQLVLFRSKTLKERRMIQGLPPARADVILAGGTILYVAMEKLGCPSVMISCHGVRYGLLYKKMAN